MMTKERRRRTRVPLKLDVVLSLDNQKIPVKTSNLSLKGMLCRTPRRFPLFLQCHVSISLTPEIQVMIAGRIVRSDERETAIDFLEMDPESFAILKRMVECNAGDAERITAEILTPAF